MHRVKLLIIAILVFAVPAIVAAAPPPNDGKSIEAFDETGIEHVLRAIMKRLDDIEGRLSRIEQSVASLGSSPISYDVERGMQFDAMERTRRHLEATEGQVRPFNHR